MRLPHKKGGPAGLYRIYEVLHSTRFQAEKNGVFVYDDLLAQYKKRMQVELAASSFYDLNFIFDKLITPCFHGKSMPTLVKADFATGRLNSGRQKTRRAANYMRSATLQKSAPPYPAFYHGARKPMTFPII